MPIGTGGAMPLAAAFDEGARARRRRALEAVLLACGAAALALALTYPMVVKIDRAGRVRSADGQFSIWNVSWVANSLLTRPDRIFDANIYYPHKNSLAFSEANLVAGAMAVPAYWLTRNPYVAHHSVVLLGFFLSAVGMYLLVRYLTLNRGAAAVAAITFAYCPFIFARTAHIQLLLSYGLPFVLLAFHRFVDRVSLARAAALGITLAVTALACAYYGIFAALAVSLGLAYFAVTRRLWARTRFWVLSAVAALVSILIVYPFLRPYAEVFGLGQGTAFRSLEDAAMFAADWRAWVTAGGWGNGWMMVRWGRGNEVLFPGFVALALGLVGVGLGVRDCLRRVRRAGAPPPAEPPADRATGQARGRIAARCSCEYVGFYVILAVGAFWLSFGPKAGLYTILYTYVPLFTLLRAPGRVGIVVALAVSALAGMGLAALLHGRKRAAWMSALVGALAIAELGQVPLYFPDAPPRFQAYRMLAELPRGPVAEFPFFWLRQDFPRHAYYMLNSTWHWQPLVNGYSDYFPSDFRRIAVPLSTFPSRTAFSLLAERRVLYVVFHLDFYDRTSRQRLLKRLEEYGQYLRPLARQDDVWLYQIVAFP